MTVQAKSQEVTNVVSSNKSTILKNNKYPGFQAPFSERRVLLVLGDGVMMVLALFGAFLFWYQTATAGLDITTLISDRWYWFPILLSSWWVLAWPNDLYDIPSSFDKMTTAMRVAVVGLINLVLYLAVFFLIPNQLPRAFFLYFLAIVWSAITLWRIVYAIVLVQPSFQRRALIVGAGRAGRTIARAIKEYDPGCEIIGYIADDAPKQEGAIKPVSGLCKWNNLTTFIQEYGISDIVLAEPRDISPDRLQLVLKCFEQGVRIVQMPELFEEITGRIPIEHIDQHWLASLPIDWDSRGLYLIIKRALDIIIAGLGLLILAPFFLILALAIKLDSPGPIFYRPERLGRGRKRFRPWKFRTMVPNADWIGDPTFTAKNDQRITRVGRILRPPHIDELPQLINILKGEMSLVGPRPERYVPELEERIPYFRTRNAVKPGATGWSIVKQGYAENLEDSLIKLQYDLYYIKHQSLSLDLLILGKTIKNMLTLKGQ